MNFTPKLVDDWKRVVAFSLSFWMQMLGLAALIIPEIRFALTGRDSDPYFLWWLGVLFLLAGTVGRIIQQGNATGREWVRLIGVTVIVTLLAVLATTQLSAAQAKQSETLEIAVPFISGWEGKRNTAYQDIVGVWTICYGSTRGVKKGMRLSDADCLKLLKVEVAEYRHKLHRYFTEKTKVSRLTPERDTAYTSLAFNAGIRAIGRSTATRRLNDGNIRGGCHALTWWNKAGGRVVRGLVRRRTAERDLCMKGMT